MRFTCDQCGHTCDHSVFGVRFAIAWIASGRTKIAQCCDYGARTDCCGILKSGLTDQEIDDELQSRGYDKCGNPVQKE